MMTDTDVSNDITVASDQQSIFLYSRHRRHKAIDIITTDAQIETAHIANLQATVAETFTIDAVDINIICSYSRPHRIAYGYRFRLCFIVRFV
jgi:hypothetical protein